MKEATITPFAKPLYIMTKPVGAVCNLACDYCYYLEKSKLYEEQPRHVMSMNYWRNLLKNIFSRKPCRKFCLPGMGEKL